MALTVGLYQIANTSFDYVAISPVIGGYDLIFGFKIEPLRSLDRSSRKADLHGAHCMVKASSGKEKKLGYARFDVPVSILADTHTVSAIQSAELRLSLSPQQLAALDEHREGGNLSFDLTPAGHGQGQAGQHLIQDNWRRDVTASEWIQKLRESGAADTLLLEVPLTWSPKSKKAASAGQHLKKAQGHFYHGDYSSCVATCRLVVEELYGKAPASRPTNADGQTKGRREYNKSEREIELVEAARNYANPAHHAENEGGEVAYTRSEARFLLTICAAIAARVLIAE